MKKLILIMFIMIIPLLVYSQERENIVAFCSDYGIIYDNYSYKDDTILLNNIRYRGVKVSQIEIKGNGPYAITFSNISGADYTIAYIKAGISSFSDFLATIRTLSLDADKGLTEERYTAEEEAMCEYEGDCGDEHGMVTVEVHNKNWDVNLSDLLEKAKGLGLTNITVSNIRSPTFNVDILELSNLDMKTYLTDLVVQNLNFKTARSADTIFHNEFKSLDFSLKSVELKRLDFISFVHFFADIAKRGSYITFRYPRWYEVYSEELSAYFVAAPFTVKSIRNFDATIVENGVAVRIYSGNSSGEMRRGEEITNSDLKFSINVKADTAALTDQNAKDVFKNNYGSIDIAVKQKRRQNTSDKYKNRDGSRAAMIDNNLSIKASKHFEIIFDTTYLRLDTIKPSNYKLSLGSVIKIERLFSDYINRSVIFRLDNYIPVLEKAPLKNMRFANASFSYKDKGLLSYMDSAPNFKFDKMMQGLASLKSGASNGQEIYAMLKLFLKDPKSLSFNFEDKNSDFPRYPFLVNNFFWNKPHTMSVEINGKKADVIMKKEK